MIYRFEILAESGLYEGWAPTFSMMKDKANKLLDGEDTVIFFSGNAPKHFTFKQYKLLQTQFTPEQIQVLDQVLLEEDTMYLQELITLEDKDKDQKG